MSKAEAVRKVAYHPFSVVSLATALISSGGLGVYKGNKAIKGLSNRMDVIIYLLCEDQPKCIEEAWKEVISKNQALDARHGDH